MNTFSIYHCNCSLDFVSFFYSEKNGLIHPQHGPATSPLGRLKKQTNVTEDVQLVRRMIMEGVAATAAFTSILHTLMADSFTKVC